MDSSDLHLRASIDTNMDLHAEGYFESRPLSDQELFVKDAFLVFRAMCKLTMKPLNNDRYVGKCIYRALLITCVLVSEI